MANRWNCMLSHKRPVPLDRLRLNQGEIRRFAMLLAIVVSGMCVFSGQLVVTAAKPAQPASQSRPAAALPPQQLPDFSADDFRGRRWTQDDFKDAQITVLAFLGTECPLAKLYSVRLQEMQDAGIDDGVRVVAVMSNRHDSMREIAAFAKRHSLSFPVLKDAGNRIADDFAARRTPEVFVYDRNGELAYHGRVDDQYGVGYVRDEPRRRDLKMAIDDLIAGRPVRVPRTNAVGCIIGRQKISVANSDVTYTGDIAPILNARCVSCHREGEIAPFALTEYEEVAGWADMIAEVVRDQRMPPWHAAPGHASFLNDRSLTDQEKATLYAWVDAGCPQGDESDLPPTPTFTEGWQLPRKPDLIVDINEKPFDVPAMGEVRYQYFRVDPKLTEDKWIKAAELLPGNRMVVHHILAFARKKGQRGGLNAQRGYLVGYVPGTRIRMLPNGMAKRLPADSELIFQVHYTPIGTPQKDSSTLCFVFA
ncbi:MAG: redoxin domain-containing protein, partial [Planctomycetota bacterium]